MVRFKGIGAQRKLSEGPRLFINEVCCPKIKHFVVIVRF